MLTQRMQQEVTPEEIKDWSEHRVSRVLLKSLQRELDFLYDARAQILIWENAQEEQSRRAVIVGEEKRIADFIDLLTQEDQGVVDLYLTEVDEEDNG